MYLANVTSFKLEHTQNSVRSIFRTALSHFNKSFDNLTSGHFFL